MGVTAFEASQMALMWMTNHGSIRGPAGALPVPPLVSGKLADHGKVKDDASHPADRVGASQALKHFVRDWSKQVSVGGKLRFCPTSVS
ncbi:hypothetical protein LX36DRAFT_658488 [Colletotrichum falcatum]|nr:hypothetical protein LX36DRAFT_658488 [Colletotrichum falcatum]